MSIDPSFFNSTWINQGVEREGLRVNSKAKAALTPHPEAFGSKLTHPKVTTDFSENLLEFITGVNSNSNDLLSELASLHGHMKNVLEDEFLWSGSMPSVLPEDEKIPLAYYGESNVGKLKTLYRNGLSYRYGRSMQTIAGIHYNFSFNENFWQEYKKQKNFDGSLKEFKNEQYFHLIRNFRRYSWVLMYLYGATPAVHESFLKGKKHNLTKVSDETYADENAISLRMGGLGYTSSAQKDIGICYNAVETYIKTLEKARLTSYPEYEKIGLIQNDEYKQLNTNLLQIDNEFYSTIRPKNIARSRESALGALYDRGIEYIELRLLDINPFLPYGISIEQSYFLQLFLSWCLFKDSPGISSSHCQEIDENFQLIVKEGRKKSLLLTHETQQISREDFLNIIFEELTNFAHQSGDQNWINALEDETKKIADLSLLPSEKVFDGVKESSYVDFFMNQSKLHFEKYTCDDSCHEKFLDLAKKSLEDQAQVEANDKLTFDDFLNKYFSDIRIKFD